MQKYFQFILIILVLLSGMVTFQEAFAQEDESALHLSMSRDFGYSSGTGRIQGTFSMKASGPDDLIRVVFRIDGEVVSEDVEAPFRVQFLTDNYSPAEHSLSAVGYTAGGGELTSNEIKVVFVTAEEGGKAALGIVIPLLGVVFGLMALSFLVPIIMNRGKRSSIPLGQPRNYGLAGGTICPKCSRPFVINVLGPNLLVGKLDRCPHCGKWSLVRRYPLDRLRTAETAELAQARIGEDNKTELSEEAKIQKALDDSRYQDL